MLLYYEANPLYLTQSKKSCIDLATNPTVKQILKKAKHVYILMRWATPKAKQQLLEMYGKNYWSTFKITEINEFENEESEEHFVEN